MCAANGGHTATVEALLSHKAGVDLQIKVSKFVLCITTLRSLLIAGTNFSVFEILVFGGY